MGVLQLAIALLDLTNLSADASEAGADAPVPASCCGGNGSRVRVAGVRRPLRRPPGRNGVRIATVVNFPTGDEPLDRATSVAAAALAAGADELDVVLPYREWLAGDAKVAADMLTAVRDEAGDRVMKVIIESGSLPDRAAIDRASHFAIAMAPTSSRRRRARQTSRQRPRRRRSSWRRSMSAAALSASRRPGGIRTVADANVYLDSPRRSWARAGQRRRRSASVPVVLLDALESELAGTPAGTTDSDY